MTEPTPRYGNAEGRAPGFMTEDLHPRFVDGPPEYANRTDGPVWVSTVLVGEEVFGYLWADDAADAAGYRADRRAGAPGVNQGSTWWPRLREAKGRGLTPREALVELVGAGGVDGAVPQPLTGPMPFAELEAMAGPRFGATPGPTSGDDGPVRGR
jgi:hypothetical protein